MKLIRLTTDRSDALFDNNFNEDIIIKPNSQICLQAMTTQLNKDVLEITNQNNEIQFTLNGSIGGDPNFYRIFLNTGVYDSSNMEDFFADFTNKLNYAMSGDSSATLGKNWKATLNGNRVEILCKRGDVLCFTNNQISTKFLLRDNCQLYLNDSPDAYAQRDGGVINTADSFFYSIQPCGKGPSSLRAQLMEDPDTNVGFILSYVASPPAPNTIIQNSDLLYAIKYRGEANPYEVWYNEVQQPTGDVTQVLPSIVGPKNPANDIMCIDISEETVYYYILRDGVRLDLFSTANDIAVPDLYCLGVMVGNTQVWNLQNTLDPFYVIQDKVINYKKSAQLNPYGVPIPTQPTPSDTYFRFVSTDLATYLGYNENVFPTQLSNAVFNYTYQDNVSILANNAFFLKFNSDSYIVELLNLKIDSMDAMSNQHRNFLAIIPNESTIVERVAHIAPVLLWIDLKNKEQINLRQIKARIIREDLAPIFCYGTSQLVLLIQ